MNTNHAKDKFFSVDEVINFIAENEDDTVDFTGIKLFKLTMNDGTIFLKMYSDGKSIILGKSGPFISLVMNSRCFNGEDSTYSYIKKNSVSTNCTDFLFQKIQEKISREGEKTSLGKIIEAFGGLSSCKVVAHGSKAFTVKTAEKKQLCGYIKGKLFVMSVPGEFVFNQAN